jgi:uncharacterized tellurite resistance protein B-like protein
MPTSSSEPVYTIFQAVSEAEKSPFDLEKLTQNFANRRNSDWSIPEAYLCLLLSAAVADGVMSREEQFEVQSIAQRSRVLKALDAGQLSQANRVVTQRMSERPSGLQEACLTLPSEMRLTVLAHCIDIVLADGALERPEAEFLNTLTGYLEVPTETAKRIMEVMLIKNQF